jgi:hypothetical protein
VDDPVSGILETASDELRSVGRANDRRLQDVLEQIARRIDAAIILLRWTDNREQMPVEGQEEGEEEEGRDTIVPGEPTGSGGQS